ALSPSTALVAEEAMRAARQRGVVVSYDLNYRESLWKSIGGKMRARDVNRGLARYVDVMLGNEEDFTAALGFHVENVGEGYENLDSAAFARMMQAVTAEYSNLALVATTMRHAKAAGINDWGALVYHDGELLQARTRVDLAIYDRVGGGDSFASGLIY